jgi:hypothetical protein
LRTVDDKTKAHLLIFCSQKSLRVTAPVPRVSIIMVVVIVVAAVVAFVVSRVKYLSELEPPAKYNHPYHGPVDERVMPVVEVRARYTSVGASGPFVACAWVSNGVCHIVLPNDSQRRFLLIVGTKLPIATVGRQIIPRAAENALRQPPTALLS